MDSILSEKTGETLSPMITIDAIKRIHRSLFSEENYNVKLIGNSGDAFSQFSTTTPEDSYRIEIEIHKDCDPIQMAVRWERQTLLHKLKRVLST